jgi:hypothetical protein
LLLAVVVVLLQSLFFKFPVAAAALAVWFQAQQL